MSARIVLHVTPRSGRNEIIGWRGGELCVRVTAPPEDGKANASVCKLVAKRVGVPKSAVHVVRGETSRHKTLEIEGKTEDDLADVFGGAS
ncbi:MAG: YggU family protein [Coriobacteriia bacterium]|nr:YggU family protein [Coriobacteriia bacterium]MBN2822579.1 YggU family protein [Coriobacteriia bacterium]